MLKRLFEHIHDPVSKRTRSNHPILSKPFDEHKNNLWISATEFDNFVKGDKFSDWMDVIRKAHLLETEDYPYFIQQLFAQGIEYEKCVIDVIRQKTGMMLEKHSTLQTSRDYLKYSNKSYDKIDMNRVLESMSKGEPLIYSAFLQDEDLHLRGIPDLLVRNDYIHTLFNFSSSSSLPETKSSIFGNYYYIPVEIKFSSVHLNKTGDFILNKDRMKIYKVQLYVYCKLLETIQGILPTKAYVIGKKTLHGESVYNSIEYPGMIDYTSSDSSFTTLFEEGYEWLRDVKKHAHNWDVYKKPFLFPNLKVDHCLYQPIKKEIARNICDITEIWQCSARHRDQAFGNGITSWKDLRCTASALGISPAYQFTVDQILKTNRGELGDYYPKTFQKNTNNFRQVDGDEMFVDFEVVSKNLNIEDDVVAFDTNAYLFLIGVEYKNKYRSFLMKELTKEEEKRVMREFYNFWKENEKPKIWYWYADLMFWNKGLERNELVEEMKEMKEINNENKIWNDLYEVFYKEPFTVIGCKNFKLKSYIKSLKEMGKIDVELPPSGCTNGLDALIIAWKYYINLENGGHDDENNENNENKTIKDSFYEMIEYNRLDCKYLSVLIDFIRNLKK